MPRIGHSARLAIPKLIAGNQAPMRRTGITEAEGQITLRDLPDLRRARRDQPLGAVKESVLTAGLAVQIVAFGAARAWAGPRPMVATGLAMRTRGRYRSVPAPVIPGRSPGCLARTRPRARG